MKKIYLNLKRFDIPKALGGINNLAVGSKWAEKIVQGIITYNNLDFTIFFPEAYILSATSIESNIKVGCQGVYYKDVAIGGNFGAYTSYRTAKSMHALGVADCLIGHFEERLGLQELLNFGGGQGNINSLLNQEVKRAHEAGMNVLYCIGEKAEEQLQKYQVLKQQLAIGLEEVDLSKVTIAYEPIWAIGVGKTPPNQEYITDIVRFIKNEVDCQVVYGGGLKAENAKMLASIDELDGGLIALTRFGTDFGFYLEDFNNIVQTYLKGLNK